ncbi:MAG: SDR family NAD(P)-dependent oxidoreductase [Desulfobacterales bacterium]|jgi:NAD(P)-dependent dehydrogenase (short-subunit alcohol dehydrogenase family)
MFSLSNKRAIVTGAASVRGIGRAIALALAHQGADVAVCDIDLQGVKNLASEIRKTDREALAYQVDVTRAAEIARMVDDLYKRWNRVDILVNNAGITQRSKVIDMSETDWDRVLDVNLKGTFLFTKALLPAMISQKYGRIINMGSVSGKRGGGIFGGAHYSAAKAGVQVFAKALAREVSPEGITVNSVAPGLIATDIRGGLESTDEQARMSADIPCRRMGTPEEVAAVVCFLASDEAAYITGEEIDINGGSHMD